MPTIKKSELDEIVNFFGGQFRPLVDMVNPVVDIENQLRDITGYAQIAQFLANATLPDQYMNAVAWLLQKHYDEQCDPDTNQRRKGAFYVALGKVAAEFGFSPTVCVLSGSVEDRSLHAIVSGKQLFRDLITAKHGEYTHALQWLWLARAARAKHPLLVGANIPQLYSRSFSYFSRKNDYRLDINNYSKPKNIFIWQLIVDCFSGGDEDYTKNARSMDLRCPQVFSGELSKHGATTHSWLPSFIHDRSTKETKKYLTLNTAGKQMAGKQQEYRSPYVPVKTLGGFKELTGVYVKQNDVRIKAINPSDAPPGKKPKLT